jgi:threonine aldolase
MTRSLPSVAGRFTTDQVRAAARKGDLGHVPTTRIVAIENTHNAAGGRVWPLEEVEAMAETCRELDLKLHLDGARLFNAAVASGVAPSAIAGHADTVTICFSKGLGCPLGAVVAGSAEHMVRARRFKHQFGGAMRQAGIVAAGCVYALDHNVDRLAEDHARARRLAEALHESGVAVDLERVETNFVQLDVGSMGLETGEATERLAAEGVRVSGTLLPGVLRAVTHLGITDEDIDHAVEVIPRALGAQRSPAMKNAAATQT